MLEYSKENGIEIIGIAETNISGREGRYISVGNTDYRMVWADSDEKKKKGSGVGIAINKK